MPVPYFPWQAQQPIQMPWGGGTLGGQDWGGSEGNPFGPGYKPPKDPFQALGLPVIHQGLISGQGLTPNQRAMLSAAMSRSIGRAGEAGQEALSRRLSAQGIGGTGLGNAALSGAQGDLLGLYQQGLSDINKADLEMYMNFLNLLAGQQPRQETPSDLEKVGGSLLGMGAGYGLNYLFNRPPKAG